MIFTRVLNVLQQTSSVPLRIHWFCLSIGVFYMYCWGVLTIFEPSLQQLITFGIASILGEGILRIFYQFQSTFEALVEFISVAFGICGMLLSIPNQIPSQSIALIFLGILLSVFFEIEVSIFRKIQSSIAKDSH